MEVVILKTDGMPVKLDSSFTGLKRFDVNGFLVEFNNQSIYKFYQTGDFKKSDQEGMTNLEGYYKESDYLKYFQNEESDAPTIVELKNLKFNFEKFKAQAGDLVIVKVIDFKEPYEYFYREQTYTFNIENAIGNSGIMHYKIRVYQNFKLISWKVNIPPDIIPVTNSVNLLTTANGYFYSKNFGQDVNGWPITSEEKSNIKEVATLIAFKIFYLEKEIIQKILTPQELSVIEAEANSKPGDVITLTGLELLVFTLKKSWGYFYAPNSDPLFIHRHSFDKIFSGNPDFQEYKNYYNSLDNFYKKIYPIRDLVLVFEQNYRLKILLQLLSVSGLRIIPYEIIKGVIKDFLKNNNITEKDEQFLVRVVLSIDFSKADDFLDFLLLKQDGKTTTFEGIYNLLDDARLERYTVVNWFVTEQTNRKYFVYAIYELWKKSKYNIQYFPSGVLPDEDVDVNPNAYFIINSEKFSVDNVLTFGTTTVSVGSTFGHVEVSFESSIDGHHIIINRKEQTTEFKRSTIVAPVSMVTLPPKRTLFGTFHIYQSISLVGYKGNLDLEIPNSNMPAFLFRYVEEYDELVDFDAGVSLAIDLTIEAVLFYFTGGASVLKDLRYLKYVTKLGKALRNKLPSSEVITVWRGLEVGSEIFTLTAGALTVVNDYLITAENDPVKRAFKERMRLLFVGLLFVGAGAIAFSRARAVKEGSKILDDINALPAGVAHGLSNDMILLLQKLKGNITVSLSLFGNRLNALNLNNLLTRYNQFTDDLKLAFWNDFKNLDDVNALFSWQKLNETANINNWVSLHNLGALQEAKTVTFLVNQRLVNGIQRYYLESGIKEILKGFSYDKRKSFVDDLGEIATSDFNKLVNNTNIVGAWGKSYDDSLLMSYLDKLSKSNKLDFLETFCIEEVIFNRLRKNPTYVDYWNSLTQGEKNLVKIRRLESITSVQLDIALLRSGPLRNPARTPLLNENILLSITEGLQTLRFSGFINPVIGNHGDSVSTYLWTLDKRGLNIALENTAMPTPRGNIVHSNLSSQAYIAGEAWFVSVNKVVINAGSGRFGYGSANFEQWKLAISYWENLSYEVQVITFNKR